MQYIGMDIGRGFVKIFTVINNKPKEFVFKSIVGDGRTEDIDFDKYEAPICIGYESKKYFVGELSEKESYSPIRNNNDSKVSRTAELLFVTGLLQAAVEDNVSIMLGVPNKSFRKSEMCKVINKYQGKTFEIQDAINNTTKRVTVNNINIFREADAALMGLRYKGLIDNEHNHVGLVSVGFNTSEFSYFERGGRFRDSLSSTLEYGNKDALKIVRDRLMKKNLSKETFEIDFDTEPATEEMKESAYELMSEKLNQYISDIWKNTDEMNIRIAGGTSMRLNFDNKYKMIENPQMATAEGLYYICSEQFGGEIDGEEDND